MATGDEYGDFPNWGLRLAVGFGIGVVATVASVRLAFGGADVAFALAQAAASAGTEVAAEVDAESASVDERVDEVEDDEPAQQSGIEVPAATAFVGEDTAPLVPFDATYCAALSDLWRNALTVMLGPANGDWPTFADDLAALADSVDAVAAIAPDEHRDLLTDAAEAYRSLGSVPWEQARLSPLFTGDQTLGFPTDDYFEHVCMHRSDSYG